MMKLRSFYWLYVGLILAEMPACAAAQSAWTNETFEKKLKRSHLVDPARFGLPNGNAEELFQQRLKMIHTKEEIKALRYKYGQTPGQLDQLVGKNPEFIEKFLKNFKIEDLPAELRKRFAGRETELEKIIRSMTLRDFLNAAEGVGPLPDTGEVQAANPPAASSTPADKPALPSSSGAPPEDKAMTQEPGSSDANPDEPAANSVLGRWLLDAAERFKDLDPALRNSPALRRALRGLSRKIDGVDEQWRQLDKGASALADKWARLGQALPLDRFWPQNGFSWPRSLSPQSLPRLRWSQARSRFTSSSSPSVPQSVTSKITQNGAWRSLGMLVILVASAVLLRNVWKQARAGGLGEKTSVWKLGPWPVDPAAVRTSEELIRAFEYLSVLRLGPAARHWHHWAIAWGLGGSSRASHPLRGWGDPLAQRRQAALELASLYEQARYAPPAETLSEAALAEARRDLCLLAGVPNS